MSLEFFIVFSSDVSVANCEEDHKTFLDDCGDLRCQGKSSKSGDIPNCDLLVLGCTMGQTLVLLSMR